MKIPAKLGACADLLFSLQTQRYKLQKEVEELKKEEAELREHIINTLPKSEANGIAGKTCRVTIKKKRVAQIKDFDKLMDYVFKNRKKGGLALIQRRVNDGAVKEIWEDGKVVPGVEGFDALSLSINKLD